MFSAYDTNSAFLTLNLQQQKIAVTTVTSEVPLYKWNKILITDTLHICSEYQVEEIKYLPEVLFKKIEFGAPEKYFEVKDNYVEPPLLNFNLGFISTGGWIRNKLGHIDQGTDIENQETKVLKDLNSILAHKKQIKLIIYPHPREVKFFNNSVNALSAFYKKLIPDIDFLINTSGKPTNQLFNETYLTLCFMSTSIFERVHAKRKSAIVYFSEDIFPVKFTSDYLKFISTEKELEQLIQQTYFNPVNSERSA